MAPDTGECRQRLRECKSAISKRSNRLRLKAYIGGTAMPPSGLSGATFLGLPTT